MDPCHPDLAAIRGFLEGRFDRDRIAAAAQERLSWRSLFTAAGVLPAADIAGGCEHG
jgi:hypothetical protein